MKRVSVVAGLAVVLAFVLGGVARAAVKKTTGQSRSEVVHFWTDSRMNAAVPVERAGKGAANAGKPTATPYPFTALTPPQPYTTFPTNTNGKVYFTEGKTNYVCSGTALSSSNLSVVWTAGHCVNKGGGAFHTNWMFVPAYLNGQAPYGKFTARQLFSTPGWVNSGDFRYDVGAAAVATSSTTGTKLTSALGGGRTLAAGGSVLNAPTQYVLYGYPAAKPFNGETLRGCQAPLGLLDPNSAAPKPMGVGCNMTGGSSGGAWLNPSGQVISVNSFGYQTLKDVMFGPQQDAAATDVYSAAASLN